MMTPDTATNAPQFGTAEYAGSSGYERCKSCGQSIGSTYYRVNGVPACQYCGEQAMLRGPQDSHQVFVRSLVFGVAAAILGLILYSAFGIVTGLMIGYVSLAVGYLVGKGMMKGSNGVGGRRYQVAAVLLTYAAVSMSAIPIGISQFAKQQKAAKQGLVRHAAPDAATHDSAAADSTADAAPVEPTAPPAKPKVSIGAAIGLLAFAGLASPFLELQEPVQGMIGLIILFVGIRIAWKLTAGTPLAILGPFSKSSPEGTNAGS